MCEDGTLLLVNTMAMTGTLYSDCYNIHGIFVVQVSSEGFACVRGWVLWVGGCCGGRGA